MADKPTYYDKRSDFWKKYWDMALTYDEFMKIDPENAPRWHEFMGRVPDLNDEQKARLQDYNRIVKVLVYGGVWCGDCVRQGPIFKKIADAVDDVEIRFIDRDTSDELQDEVRILGATRVPIVVFLTEDYWEVGREGDRLLPVYRAKAAREIGRGQATGVLSPKAIEEQLDLWVDIFERAIIMTKLSPPLRKRHKD
jgi:thiol-disulfide isomerase/thioredoxin